MGIAKPNIFSTQTCIFRPILRYEDATSLIVKWSYHHCIELTLKYCMMTYLICCNFMKLTFN